MATNRVSPSPSLEGSLNGDTLPLRERSSDPRGQRSPHQRRGSDDQVIGAGEELLEPVYKENADTREYTPELLPLETDQGSLEVAQYENPEMGRGLDQEQQGQQPRGSSRESRNEGESPVPVVVESSQKDLQGSPVPVGPVHPNYVDKFQTQAASGQSSETQDDPDEDLESPRYDPPVPVNIEENSKLKYEEKSGFNKSQLAKSFGGGMAVGGPGRFSPLSRSNRISPEGQESGDPGPSYGYENHAEHSAMYNRDRQSLLERKQTPLIGAESTDDTGCCAWVLYIFSILLIIITLPFSLMFTIKVVQEYERAVIFRLGRLPSGGAKGPGIFFIIPCIESYTKIDLRTVSFDVPPQEVLTKDSVTVSVDAVVYYRVSNPTISVANVENAHHSTRLLAQTTLRNILGTKNMSEILSDRESISQGIQTTLDDATDRWGIKVERVEIKDVRLPVQLQRAMAAEAEAAREARAKVIAAEGEQKASRALKEAADVMNESTTALQLRYLQTLNSISAEKNSTILFPVPIDLISSFKKK